MIVWGATAGYLAERAAKWMLPGIERNIGDGDLVVTARSDRIAVGHNQILDTVERFDCPVVLMHDDTELLWPARNFLVEAWRDGVDVVGVVGGVGVTSLEWWAAPRLVGRLRESRGLVGDTWEDGPADVDAVDGLLLGLSARAAKLRFDTEYPGFHGYDVDFCFHARRAGLRVAVWNVPVVHHTKGGFGDEAAWAACYARWGEKWSG